MRKGELQCEAATKEEAQASGGHMKRKRFGKPKKRVSQPRIQSWPQNFVLQLICCFATQFCSKPFIVSHDLCL